ncbi:MAG TPA: outer membrane protein assembly factor BamE [Candidatus Sulfotelmatobacter sp.]|nr:outer membrane protein assembly factor BamE [Candidatus Sulfotelmatobacter sp.]
MKTTTVLIGLASMLLAGCLTSSSTINSISLGMNKAQVLKIMGTPVSVIADTNSECLNYNLAEVPTAFDMPGTPYEIKLVDGKVVSYGRAGSAPTSRPVPMPVIVPVVH